MLLPYQRTLAAVSEVCAANSKHALDYQQVVGGAYKLTGTTDPDASIYTPVGALCDPSLYPAN